MAQRQGTQRPKSDVQTWLAQVRPKHERLTTAIVALFRSLLKTQGIDFLSVEGRTKDETSIIEKCDRKSYNNPQEQLTDISGIRIVTFLEIQVAQITSLVRSNFDVDEKNSLDRSEILGSDRIGYRSSHFVCTINSSRNQLPEYSGLQGLKFELQIRTVLQHAWAELAHDRSFKLGLELPTKIQRRLNLHAGLLEVVDSAFDEIAREIDAYRLTLSNVHLDQIVNAEINSISLEQFLNEISKTNKVTFIKSAISADVVKELRRFGTTTIGDLTKLATPALLSEMGGNENEYTGAGFLRDIMLYSDIDKYFDSDPGWGLIELKDARRLAKKWGAKKLARIFVENDIIVRHEDDGEFTDRLDDIELILG
jgi:ppGpp synthetase/RelA/SpoT-type nucleotidyltranferase